LMDVQMPVMDGYTATKKIRKMEAYKTLPIIAMTANVMKTDLDLAHEAGMDCHIGKPLNVKEMFKTLSTWIKPKNSKVEVSEVKEELSDGIRMPELEGIDTEAGLKVTAGNVKLYHKILLKFYDSQKTFRQDFVTSLESSDASESERLAHTLKGVAGSIGAKAVQELATELEKLCVDNRDKNDLLSCLDRVQEKLAVVIQALETNFKQDEDEVLTESGFDLKLHEEEIKAIIEQCDSFDTGAMDRFGKLCDLSKGSRYHSEFNEIYDLMSQYDLEKAGDKLKSMLSCS